MDPKDEEFDEDELEESLNAVQLISVAPFVNETKCTNFIKCNSLLDTGSPASFIQQPILPEEIQIGDLLYSHYKGIGDSKIYTYGTIFCHLKFAKQMHKVSLLIIPDGILPMPLLIGRDILRIFNITLRVNLGISSEQKCISTKNKRLISNRLYLCTYFPLSVDCKTTVINNRSDLSGNKLRDNGLSANFRDLSGEKGELRCNDSVLPPMVIEDIRIGPELDLVTRDRVLKVVKTAI